MSTREGVTTAVVIKVLSWSKHLAYSIKEIPRSRYSTEFLWLVHQLPTLPLFLSRSCDAVEANSIVRSWNRRPISFQLLGALNHSLPISHFLLVEIIDTPCSTPAIKKAMFT